MAMSEAKGIGIGICADLESEVELGRVGRERSKHAGDARANIGAEDRRVHAVHRDDSDADEGGEGRGGDRGGLHADRDDESDEHRDVPREPAQWDGHAAALEVREVAVDGAMEPHGDPPLEE